MQKVVTINLNGHAYQLDEAAFDALRTYLKQAEIRLKDNPDRVEIHADLERAIAEKCNRFLGPHKTVVGAAEMDQIVTEMGPVEGTDGNPEGATAGTAAGGPQAGRSAPKRLYRIREGQMIGGVCTGLAAYFNVDPTLVRIPFLVLLWTGVGGLAYIALMVVIPYADTPEEQAAASGQPFNAQELIDSIKRHAADFKDHGKWKQEWREQTRRWRAEHRAWRQQFRHTMRDRRWWGPMPMPPVGSSRGYEWAGLLLPIFSLLNLAFFVLLALSILSLVNTGGLYGWPLPNDVPLWAGILILVVLYQVATSPFRAARHASYYAWGRDYGWFAMWDGLIATGATIVLIWLLFTYMPPVDNLREFVENLPEAFRALGRDISMWFRDLTESAR